MGSEKSSSTEAFFVVLKASVLSESKTASEMRFMPASEGETLLLQVADGALFEACGSRDKNSFVGQINVIFQHKSNLS